MRAPSILCIHPNGELYGSDRVFLQSVRALRERWPTATITALLPFDGPLAAELRKIISDVRVEDIYVLRRSELGWRFALRMPKLALRVLRARRLMAARDLNYVSTVVTADFILASRLLRRPILVHVHELPTGVARQVFSGLLRASHAVLVHISDAVRDSFVGLGGKRAFVVPNGVSAFVGAAPESRDDGRLRLLLIGRFNAWKGQPLLLDALALLPAERRARIDVRLVGSVYADQTHFADAIHDRIARHGLHDTVTVLPFDPDPAKHYGWADAVVVPSTQPEPFGLVAIEAMAAGKAVIAAGHGGLAEIVVDDLTGALVTPGDADALARAISAYLDDPARLRAHGDAGAARFAEQYDERIYRRGFADVAAGMIGDVSHAH